MKKTIILLCSIFTIFSCEELEIEIQELERTDFTVVVNTTDESIVLNETLEFSLLLEIEEPKTEDVQFSLTYFDSGIKGVLSINGINYQENETINNIPLGNTIIAYKGSEIGSGNLTLQIEDSNGKIKNIDVPVSIQKTDFEFEVLFDKEENYVNEFTNFSIDIQREGEESLTYKAYFKNIEGVVQTEDSSVPQNTKFDLQEGSNLAKFKGTKTQDSEIEFVVEASNGLKKSKKIQYNVLSSDFEFTVLFEKNENYIFERTNFIIDIRKNGAENLSYKAYFQNVVGAIGFANGATNIPQNTVFDLSEGVTKAYFQGTAIQETLIEFVIEASNGARKSQTVNYSTLATDFEFSVVFGYEERYVNDVTSVKISLDKKGSEELIYKAYFTDVRGNLLLPNDNQVFQNQIFNIDEGNTLANFKGTSIQNASIEFVVEASNGVVKRQKVNYNILPTDFEVIINPIPIRSFFKFNALFDISIIKPPVDNQFIFYTMTYYTTTGKSTRLTIRDIDTPEGINDVYDFGTRTHSSASIKLSDTNYPASGEIVMIFTDSNGVEVRKTVELEFYDDQASQKL